MEVELIVEGLNFTEGPLVDEGGTLIYGEMLGAGLYLRSADGVTRVLDSNAANVGGVAFTADGGVVYSTRTGLKTAHLETGKVARLDLSIDGQLFAESVNDLAVGPDGTLYAGTIDHSGFETGQKPRQGFFFRVDPDNSVRHLRNVGLPNGIDFDEGGRLYLSESGEGVFTYEVRSDGSLGDRRLFAQMEDSDGIVLDAVGGLWVARYLSNKLEYYDVKGRLAESVELPFANVSNVTFGGPSWQHLYVTGGHLSEQGRGGVACFAPQIAGHPPRFALLPGA